MLSPGTRLGSFEVLGPLGAGGMGEVYRATDTRLKREVALKILPEAFAQDPGRLARFEREARLLAALNHPGLAAIYGLEQDGAIRYIVMELVPGETLDEALVRGPLPQREALLIARQIAEALEAAHDKGVIHRDLKPSNIKVTPAGKVKVLDLGLAKAMDPVSDPSDASRSPTAVLDQTRPGVILGTAEFMSPEQARGKPLDKRTDIWSFGCVLFEMLSGHSPFARETISDVIAAILSAEPAWTVLPEATPPRIQDLLRRCLEKDLAKRLRDAGDATIEIDQSLAEIGSGGRQAPRTPAPAPAAPAPGSSADDAKRRRVAAPAVLAAAVVLGAIAGWYVLRSRQLPKARPAAGSLVVLPSRDLSGAPGGQLIGDAFVEMLSVRLGQVPGVQVVTPVAAIAASDAQNDPLQAARSVGARMAVRSSIMRSGDALRILYSVWDVETRRQIAGGQIDGPASDLFGIQDRLLDRIAADLNIESPGERGRTPTPPGLSTATQQERYLQAIGSLQRADKAPSVDEAVRLLEGLAAEAPGSALVHAALGRAYLARYAMTREKSWAERARAEAESARRLDPAPGEVDVTLGSSLLLAGERDRAEEAFRRALAARPSNVEALIGLGRAREKAGDWAAAEQSYRKAIEQQPFLYTPYNELGGLYFERGHYAEAADVYRRLTRITPDSYSAFNNLGGSLSMTCDFDHAADAYRRALTAR
ncbi:MAG TPA: protein kinase, partial [Thermoanaerobaculia bacterium]